MAKAMKEHKVLYLLMVPGLLYFVLFRYLPMFGLVIAFKDYNIFKGIWASDWVGLANFEALVHSSDFWNVMKNTLVISLTKILIGFPIPILLAILLNDIKSMRFKRVTQTFLYLPQDVYKRQILFICGGAFPDLEDIIKERLTNKSSIGFAAELKDKFDKDPNILGRVMNEDLRKFGMIPEFLGRLPITVTLQSLTKELLVRILKEPRNAILKQYEKLLELDEVKLVFEDEALEWIAEQAMKKETGARALRSIIEDFMLDIMYEIPKDPEIGSVVITRAYLDKNGGPLIRMRGYH